MTASEGDENVMATINFTELVHSIVILTGIHLLGFFDSR
jgi:hypothetical protein